MTGVIRYDIVCGDLDSLPEQVNRLLEGGWELHVRGATKAVVKNQSTLHFFLDLTVFGTLVSGFQNILGQTMCKRF